MGGCWLGRYTFILLPPPTDSSEGALEGMVRGLRQGGVSLLGRLQPLTHEQWRSSFMRRNRDPQLNERVHRVRALQSTLKVSQRALGMARDWPSPLGSAVDWAKFWVPRARLWI